MASHGRGVPRLSSASKLAVPTQEQDACDTTDRHAVWVLAVLIALASVVAVVAALAGRPRLPVQRRVEGSAAVALAVCLVISATGAGLVLGWIIVTTPPEWQPNLADQPAPSALWQVGAVLALAGIAGAAAAFRMSPPFDAERPRGELRERPAVAIGACVAAFTIAILAAAAFAPQSQLRDQAVFVAFGNLVVGAVLGWVFA